MSFDWQNLAALAITLSAAAYVMRTGWRMMRRKQGAAGGGCGTCGGCVAASGTQGTADRPLAPPQVIPVESLSVKTSE